MPAVGSFADSPQSLLLCRVSGHRVLVPTCISSVWATSRLEPGARALLPFAFPVALALALGLTSFTLTLSPFASAPGLSTLEAFRVGQLAACSKFAAARQPVRTDRRYWRGWVVGVGNMVSKHCPHLIVPVLQLLLVY